MDSFSSIGILLQTKPKKKETQEIHGVNKIMEKSTQSPLTVKEFLVALSLDWFTCSLENKVTLTLSKIPGNYSLPWLTISEWDGGIFNAFL